MNKVIHGDCLEVLKTLPDNSVDAVVTDPPYGLSFMGKKWDYDVPQEEVWRECLRVLKPGGYLLAFAGTRTQHRMAVRIEDAGFEIRDMIAWVYGSGFPKSLNIGKAVDKINGETGRLLKFTNWMRTTGIKGSEIDKITGTRMGGHYLTIASQPAIPTTELWSKLRPHIKVEIPKWVDELVERIEAEREVIGKRTGAQSESTGKYGSWGNDDGTGKSEFNVTTASTDQAKQWEGWGTALKPSHEDITVAQKPVDNDWLFNKSVRAILQHICQYQLLAKTVRDYLALNQSELKEDVSIAQWIADERTNIQVALSVLMDMLQSDNQAANTNSNIVLSWLNTLGDLYSRWSTYTTETKISLITDLKTLNYLLAQNTQSDITKEGIVASGVDANASIVGLTFSALRLKLQTIHALSANESAIERASERGIRPNLEPITVARKPIEGTVAENCLRWNVGGLNIDKCRVIPDNKLNERPNKSHINDLPNMQYANEVVAELSEETKTPSNLRERMQGEVYTGTEPLGLEGRQNETTRRVHSQQPNWEAGTPRSNGSSLGPSVTSDRGCSSQEPHQARQQTDKFGSDKSWPPHNEISQQERQENGPTTIGRWPANLIHDGSDEVVEMFPESGNGAKSVGASRKPREGREQYSDMKQNHIGVDNYGDSGSAARFFYNASGEKHDIMSTCKNTHARTVLQFLQTIHLTTGSIAVKSAPQTPNQNLAQNVKSAGITCGSCVTAIAQSLAAMATDNTASQVIQDCTTNYANSIPHQNLAEIVQQWANTGTTPTTANLMTLFGSVLLATDANTNWASKVKVEGVSDQERATRFLYCAKASKAERNRGLDGTCTVKYNTGICTEENMVLVQLLRKVTLGTGIPSFNIDESGESITVQCQSASLSTIKMKINEIIDSKIFNSLMHSLTSEYTADANSETVSGGSHVASVESLRKYLLAITNGQMELARGVSRVALKTLSSISASEWEKGRNFHATVKPIALMEYLVKLVSREGAVVLDPFAGSGSTLLACKNLNRQYIGIEREQDYINIINARLGEPCGK